MIIAWGKIKRTAVNQGKGKAEDLEGICLAVRPLTEMYLKGRHSANFTQKNINT